MPFQCFSIKVENCSKCRSLPLELLSPTGEELAGLHCTPVGPQLPELFFEQVGGGKTIVRQKQILARVRQVLRPDGYLFLGGAETTLYLDDAFERVQVGRASCYKLMGGR